MLTRTDRRRFPILLAVIAALAMAMLFSPVQAQEAETLVSNLDTSSGSSVLVQNNEHAQQFQTGSRRFVVENVGPPEQFLERPLSVAC